MIGTRLPKPWLETLRLAMRKFVPEDHADLRRLDSDPRVMKYVTGRPATAEESATAIRRVVRYYAMYPDLGAWYTTRRDTGEFIGWFSLKYAGGSCDIEIGYWLLPQMWGQGFATEGATAMHDYGFDDLGLDRIIGVTHPDNRASQNVLMKAGLADCGWGRYYEKRLRLFAASNPYR